MPDWVEALIAIGIAAVAVYALAKLAEGVQNPETCPRCGATIHKWSRLCPNCRFQLTWR